MPQTAPIKLEDLRLDPHGAQFFPAALDTTQLSALIGALMGALVDQPADQAGVRLFDVPGLAAFLAPGGPIGAVAATTLDAAPARPVRAILFDKTPATNWSLAWHQDRVVAVKLRIETPDFGPWSRKHGALHVAPPFEILAGMRTLRVHLDPVPQTNAPLLIAPGSHTLGRIAEPDVPAVVAHSGVAACLAAPGDVWAYATPILHASERATMPAHRRVLQVDYAVGDLPGGLEWLEI